MLENISTETGIAIIFLLIYLCAKFGIGK
ncbi:hypothetical protein L326_11180 [Yersinia pestis 113]|nr:hypothetical protein L327_11270 [Yersinia pestis S3]ERP73418.1 hypothetical protein L328_11305 [Yersinia pestis 24H]ERP74253.1 hypothetical protein L326_11180 [Yersinia pestis 113]ERP82625.1 hypothetical protein L325_11200 [Yersinia pestis 9]